MNKSTFVNSFWGSDGTRLMHTKIKHSIGTLHELAEYYNERVAIEKETTKKLSKLNNKTSLGSHETGSLKMALDKLEVENEVMVGHSNKFIKSIMQSHNKIQDFVHLYAKTTGKIMHHIDKIVASEGAAWKALMEAKEKYRGDSQMYKSLQLCIQTTWGKELERNKAKLAKTGQSLSVSRKNYHVCLVTYKELHERFVQDWSIALQDIYKLEIERIHLLKVNCFGYCNHIATLCVDNDQSVDAARSVFAQIHPAADLQGYAENFGSGNKIAVVPKFVDFMQGYDDDERLAFTVANVALPEYQPMLSEGGGQSERNERHKSIDGQSERSDRPKNDERNERRKSVDEIKNNEPTNDLAGKADRRKSLDLAKVKRFDVHFEEHPTLAPTIPTLAPNVSLAPRTPSPTRKDTKPRQGSGYSSSSEELFEQEFKKSNGSNYSNPTNYSSTSERHWASPRRKEKQLRQMQNQINLKSKELPVLKPHVEAEPAPIMKDFSIDFIAKALEDLNQGGNGDVSQYRRSVRRAKEMEEQISPPKPRSVPSSPRPRSDSHKHKSLSDYVDDHDEVATRYESISFSPRPTSLLNFDDTASTVKKHSVGITPVTGKPYVAKAKARYSYKPQQPGELYFRKGWCMYVIHKQEDNWFLCELSEGSGDAEGMVGLIPGNYLVEGDHIF